MWMGKVTIVSLLIPYVAIFVIFLGYKHELVTLVGSHWEELLFVMMRIFLFQVFRIGTTGDNFSYIDHRPSIENLFTK